MSGAENHISGNLYNELFRESSEEKCTAFQSMVWSLLFINILLKTAHLFPKHFSPGLFVSFISFFIKTRVLLQFVNLVYVSQFSFVFMNAVITLLSKNLLTNKFLHTSTSITQGSCRFLFEIK